jgi:hypothetical protein
MGELLSPADTQRLQIAFGKRLSLGWINELKPLFNLANNFLESDFAGTREDFAFPRGESLGQMASFVRHSGFADLPICEDHNAFREEEGESIGFYYRAAKHIIENEGK